MSAFERPSPVQEIIRSLGLVFGDIGTSPIYTLTVVFLTLPRTQQNVMGVLSLVVWTLVLLVTVEYAWLATSLSRRGEGGTIVLKELLVPLVRTGRQTALVSGLAYIGVSLLVGDGIITPAISILSAVEGIRFIPGFAGTRQGSLILVAALIAIALFLVQKKGTERVAGAFGPIMLVWFGALAVSGIAAIIEHPSVFLSASPVHAVRFLWENGFQGFLVLSEVILCATGGEALYADMGHLGRMPIVRAWSFVFVALLLTYLGQGAHLLEHPEAGNLLFDMIVRQAPDLYVPFLVLGIAATVIASQALISGMFSVVYQGITTHMMPLLKVDYTSTAHRSQIYIASVNWFLLVAVLFIMVEFQESHKLAAAYGLAVTGTMTLTGIMMAWIFFRKGHPVLSGISVLVTLVDVVYLAANTHKIPHGGYWSLILASMPLALILIYRHGQKSLYKTIKLVRLPEFLDRFRPAYAQPVRIPGTALFLIRDPELIAPYIMQTLFNNGILYEDNILVSIIRRDDPFGATGFFRDDLALTRGLRAFEIQLGYLEVADVDEIFRENGIDPRAIFYGIEDIVTERPVLKIFALIKKLTPSYVQFYRLPPARLHGVMTRVEM